MSELTPQQRAAEQKAKAKAMEALLRKFAPTAMPFWHDETRAIANELTRCGLISTKIGNSPREYFMNEKLFTLGEDDGTRVLHTGEELRGNDEDTFLTLVHQVREQPSGRLMVKIKSSDICKANKWPTRQSYYNEIYKSIMRLSATTLVVFSKRLTKMLLYERARAAGGSVEMLAAMYDQIQAIEAEPDKVEPTGLTMAMVAHGATITGGRKADKDDVPQGDLTWEIPMDRNLVTLYAKEWLTLVSNNTRVKLSVGARRLQGYYRGHRKPHDVYVSTLGKLLKLTSPLKEQKRIVTQRLQELVDAGELKDAVLEEGLGDVKVHVERIRWNDKPDDDGPETAGNEA